MQKKRTLHTLTRTVLFSILLAAPGCFKSAEQKAVDSLNDFLGNFNYQSSEPLLKVAQKSQRAASFLAPQFKLSIKHQKIQVTITNAQQFKEHYILLRRVSPDLSVAVLKNPRISAQGSGFLIKASLNAKSPTEGEDTIFYQFYMENTGGQWLIKRGENEPLFD